MTIAVGNAAWKPRCGKCLATVKSALFLLTLGLINCRSIKCRSTISRLNYHRDIVLPEQVASKYFLPRKALL